MTIERVSTSHEIMAVANFVRSGSRAPMSLKKTNTVVDWYEVFLPRHLDADAIAYAEYLLNHPSPYVRCNFTHDDLRF